MSLEMVADPAFRFADDEAARDELAEILTILHRCRLTENQSARGGRAQARPDGGDGSQLTPALRLELLKAAQQELRGVRRQLTLGGVLWAAFSAPRRACDMADLLPGTAMRQSFHDGVCVAELLVAARRRVTEQALERAETAGRPTRESGKRGALPAAETAGT